MRGLETEVVVPIVVMIDLETSTSAAAVVEKAEPTTEAIGRDTKKSGAVSVMAALIDVANFRIYVRSIAAVSIEAAIVV